MDEKTISDNFKYLQAEIDMLRARNDVLAIALKRAVLNSHAPAHVLAAIMEALNGSNVAALYSSQPSEMYVGAFDIAVEAISKWQESLPPAA